MVNFKSQKMCFDCFNRDNYEEGFCCYQYFKIVNLKAQDLILNVPFYFLPISIVHNFLFLIVLFVLRCSN